MLYTPYNALPNPKNKAECTNTISLTYTKQHLTTQTTISYKTLIKHLLKYVLRKQAPTPLDFYANLPQISLKLQHNNLPKYKHLFKHTPTI